MAGAYFARWDGPVTEADDPYNIGSGFSPAGLPVRKHVQEFINIPVASGPDQDLIKWAIYEKGAVYDARSVSGLVNTTYWSLYSPDPLQLGGHAIALVGWDDTYSRENFTVQPPGDGAFIVKNSWGPGWGDDGYFYLSYYDMSSRGAGYLFTGESPENYDNIYQYDPLGCTGYTGWQASGWFANVFTAEQNEKLVAVNFYTPQEDCTYEVYVFLDPDDGPINSSEYAVHGFVARASGSIPFSGYHTIPLDTHLLLGAGQQYSVVVHSTTPGYQHPIPLEYPYEDYSSKATGNPGESWVSPDGVSWYDSITQFSWSANVCVKAFSNTVAAVLPLPGFADPPTDPDGDGLYEDLNGNGRLDFADVVAYFDNMEWIAENEPVECFDYNGNGRIDFNDIVVLFEEV